jgi:hypothetical protein
MLERAALFEQTRGEWGIDTRGLSARLAGFPGAVRPGESAAGGHTSLAGGRHPRRLTQMAPDYR